MLGSECKCSKKAASKDRLSVQDRFSVQSVQDKYSDGKSNLKIDIRNVNMEIDTRSEMFVMSKLNVNYKIVLAENRLIS